LDVLDFSNFLDSLSWPTKNRYIVIYNEVNRGDEWGGIPNPSEYASILSYAVTVFKSRSQDFFIISAGMDNAAANTTIAMNEYDYLSQMNSAIPGIFNQVDGIASHSYPNPAFSQPPSTNTRMSIYSFTYEKALVDNLSSRKHPVFITETGWSKNSVSSDLIANYFTTAFTSVWNNPDVVAVTPFLLQAGGQFGNFSFIDDNGDPSSIFNAVKALPKTKGIPMVEKSVLAAQSELLAARLPIENFSDTTQDATKQFRSQFKNLFKWILHIP
jgi:hypothetical protein